MSGLTQHIFCIRRTPRSCLPSFPKLGIYGHKFRLLLLAALLLVCLPLLTLGGPLLRPVQSSLSDTVSIDELPKARDRPERDVPSAWSELNSSSIARNPRHFRSQMSKAERLALSKSVFKSLRSENYQDRPFLSPEEKRDRYHRKRHRKNRRKNRGRIPSRRRAFEIASADVLKSNSFCRTELLKQRIRMEGCLTKTIVNRFCFGQCQSFFIPKLRRKRLKAAFESCSACMPIDYAPVVVTLHCPARNPPIVRRTVMKVKRCTCKAVRTS